LLYFAYGSNLDVEDWERFCYRNGFRADCIKAIDKAFLPDHELVFNVYSSTRGGGALNIHRRPGACVYGALFEVSEEGWRALDFKEGVSERVYQRIPCTVLRPDGSVQEAVTYSVVPESESHFMEPTSDYFDAVHRGLVRFDHEADSFFHAARGDSFPNSLLGVFVYGTLLSGESRSWVIESSVLLDLSTASTSGVLYETELDYPMLDIKANEDADKIEGELIFFQDLATTLAQLDKVEGFLDFGSSRNEYDRSLITVETFDGKKTLAWSYVAGDMSITTKRIYSGSWRLKTSQAH